MSKEGNYCTDSLSAERIKTSSQVVKYYERRAEILDEVLSLRENCPIDGKSLHAHTGYDYMTDYQWTAMLDQIFEAGGIVVDMPCKMRLLDAGCGSGAVIDYVLKQRNGLETKAFGVDLTPSLINIARDHVKGASFLLGDITELETFKEIAPGSLDLVTCYGVFIHLESMAAFKQCMRNLYSLLRPGGKMMVGYVLNADLKDDIEFSRRNSARAKKFEDLLQMKTLPYLYLSRRDFDAVAKELCASCYVEDMKDTFANHPAFPTLPKSFLGRFCAFLEKPVQESGES